MYDSIISLGDIGYSVQTFSEKKSNTDKEVVKLMLETVYPQCPCGMTVQPLVIMLSYSEESGLLTGHIHSLQGGQSLPMGTSSSLPSTVLYFRPK